jgi:uncharacterized protein YegP (UPF0339 family)
MAHETGIVEIKRRRIRGGYWWRLKGLNNEIVCTSHPQIFEHPTDARAAFERAQRCASNPYFEPTE